MVFIRADLLSEVIFILFSLSMLGLVFYSVWRIGYKFKQFSIIFSLYLLLFSAVIQFGLVQKYVIPVAPILFASILFFAVIFSFSNYGLKISERFTYSALIGVQVFRIPLELLLHHWAEIGTVPGTMTWTGQNWDILTGLFSLVLFRFVDNLKPLAWFLNVLGTLLLLNVLRVVIMSSPFPFAWQLENPIQLILYLPYAYIGPLFVGFALATHLIAFRKLSR